MVEQVNYDPAVVLEALNGKLDLDFGNITAESKKTIANLGTPDMGRAVAFNTLGTASNPFNFDFPVMVGCTLSSKTADGHLYISTQKNGNIYQRINTGNPGITARCSFSWLIPADYNFYFLDQTIDASGASLSTFYAPLLDSI